MAPLLFLPVSVPRQPQLPGLSQPGTVRKPDSEDLINWPELLGPFHIAGFFSPVEPANGGSPVACLLMSLVPGPGLTALFAGVFAMHVDGK